MHGQLLRDPQPRQQRSPQRTFMTSGSVWYFMMFMGFCEMSMMAACTLGLEKPDASSGLAITWGWNSDIQAASTANGVMPKNQAFQCLSSRRGWERNVAEGPAPGADDGLQPIDPKTQTME